jgi:hypothetical protein
MIRGSQTPYHLPILASASTRFDFRLSTSLVD